MKKKYAIKSNLVALINLVRRINIDTPPFIHKFNQHREQWKRTINHPWPYCHAADVNVHENAGRI